MYVCMYHRQESGALVTYFVKDLSTDDLTKCCARKGGKVNKLRPYMESTRTDAGESRDQQLPIKENFAR